MADIRKTLKRYELRLRSLRFGKFTAAALAAFAVVGALQAFASSGEYEPGAEPTLADQLSWSAPGRYFLECEVAEGGDCVSVEEDLGVYAEKNYAVTFRSNLLQEGRYKLRFDYRNYEGTLPPGYRYEISIKVNGETVAGRSIELQTDGDAPWVFEREVRLPRGESTLEIAWLNDREQRGSEINFGVISAAFISLDAEAVTVRNDSARRKDFETYRSALARYVADRGQYPVQRSVAAMSPENQPFDALRDGLLKGFIDDPTEGRDYYYVSDGPRYGLCTDLEGKPGTRLEAGPSGLRERPGRAAECLLLN